MRALCVVVALALASSAAVASASSAGAGACSAVTTSSVIRSAGLGTTPPAVNCAGLPCASYLAPVSCLGIEGPLSAMGPLGWLGPIGSNAWNPSAWMGAMGDWTQWSKAISGKTSAPLSSAGPLGAYGSLATNPNDFMKQLQAGGLFTALGPIGPLGALGPLGPLGPMGIHGFARNTKTGAYFAKAAPATAVRTVAYPWTATQKRTWELYEFYPTLAAAVAVGAAQDTSFMYESNIFVDLALRSNADVITVTSGADQFVTVAAVPQRMSDNFVVSVSDAATGRALATSSETFYVNWVQVRVKKGQRLTITTKFGATSVPSPIGFSYRLYVTGSSNLVLAGGVSGSQCAK